MAGKVGNPYHDAKGLFTTASGDADGQPSPSVAAKNLKTAEALAKLNQYGASVPTSMFKGKNETGLPHGASQDKAVEKTLKLSLLGATQMDMDRVGVEAYIRGKGREGNKLPLVVQYKDQYLISDGHHRLAAKILLGDREAKVLLTKIKDVDHIKWTATFERPK